MAGKTTLANELSKRLRAPINHLGRPPADKRHWDIVKEAFMIDSPSTIYDRMAIGSFVYGQLLHDKYNAEPVTLIELTRWLYAVVAYGGLIVWCRASEEDIRKRYARDGDWYVDLPTILKAHYLYEEAFKAIGRLRPAELGVLQYNSSKTKPEQFYLDYKFPLQRTLNVERPSSLILAKCFSGEIML